MEPLPGNVEGQKIEKQTHSFEHRIDWGYVALGVGLALIAFVGFRLVTGPSDTEESRHERDTTL